MPLSFDQRRDVLSAALSRKFGEGREDRVEAGTGQRAVEPDLAPAVPPDEVGGDSVQPRPRVRAIRVVAVPLLEGEQERLRDQVLGGADAEPAGHVAPDVRGVPTEQDREIVGLIPGSRDHRGVVPRAGAVRDLRGPGGRPALCCHVRGLSDAGVDIHTCPVRPSRFPSRPGQSWKR